MADNTREIILDTLLELERSDELSHRLIRAVLDKYAYLDERDRSFIRRVTEGTIERRIELDYYLDRYSSVPVRKMKPLIRCLLRMSVYQLLYMDSVPDSAVCNEAVKLAGKRHFQSLKGYVNGVLRKISREKGNLTLPDETAEPVKALSVRYSMPEWLVRLWTRCYGAARTRSILESLLEIHPVTIRFSARLSEEERRTWAGKIAAAGAEPVQSVLSPLNYTLGHATELISLPGYAEGIFTVQDVSSTLAVLAAGIRPGDCVLDVCAAPGGKTLLASELTGERGRVLSRDISETKTALIRENCARMRAENVEVQTWDATMPDESLYGQADVVLADVPCSGLGVLGKKRDIKYHVTPEKLCELAALQHSIIDAAQRCVKPGGVLLYSTCTLNPQENEMAARQIAESYPFTIEEERQFYPDEGCDGFYYARLRREN